MNPILEAKNITKAYEGRAILENISLDLVKGDVHVLLGPSGSGKTSLLRILAGLLDSDSGEVLLDGEAIEGPKDRLVPGYEEISIAHQDFKLKHKMSVFENIRYELLSYTKDYQLERIETLLSLFRIQHLRDKDISLLSGGEKQRVAISRAMAHEPDVLLMDEPFSNLDLGSKSSLLREIRELARKTETAILLVTHDTRDALQVADKISVLHNGSLIRQGTPKEIYEDPQKEIVATLFGPYNVIEQKNIEKLGINSNAKKVGIWPENILVSEDIESDNQLISSTFMGHYWKNVISSQELEIVQYGTRPYSSGSLTIKSYFTLE
ncbi:MAG: spermidine/putrescine ABC transporter ATP-binding protein [Flammeovirgaceae bacterium]|nr:spermidine/putrescine ABC transporter ATP-binding protein [Flammeovirgaceae bacterium]MBE62671.1 spermidine/putrescine ABC transporter ATP-binding protein [Flammeovirgaceae bacterium]HCX22048.1 spermidine/putrescine ABC transporter ATP-binding protein [Cytophagales bacterium]|tara:strand:- start:4855 stop:5823 length:969 start_codon:yes stop_codon:yes gene_type:complete